MGAEQEYNLSFSSWTLSKHFPFQAFGRGKQKQFVDKECFLDFLLLTRLNLTLTAESQ